MTHGFLIASPKGCMRQLQDGVIPFFDPTQRSSLIPRLGHLAPEPRLGKAPVAQHGLR
jgi:hypothetical protein